MKKTRVKMNKPLYLGISKLGISKTLMYNCWYDYFKLKYGDWNDVEKRFDTCNYDKNNKRPLSIGKN